MSQLSNHSYGLTYFSDNTVQMVFPRKIFIDQSTKILDITLMSKLTLLFFSISNLWEISDFLLSRAKITIFDFLYSKSIYL